MKGVCHTFPHQKGLGGMFEHNRVSRDQGGCDRIDGGHVGIVPRRDHKDNAVRDTLYIAFERGIVAHLDVCQCLMGDLGHVTRAFHKTAILSAISNGASHHLGEFRHDLIIHFANGGNTRENKFDTFFD